MIIFFSTLYKVGIIHVHEKSIAELLQVLFLRQAFSSVTVNPKRAAKK